MFLMFFDFETQKRRVWYDGCDGKLNKFIVAPSQEELCLLYVVCCMCNV